MSISVIGKSPTIITDLEKFDCEELNQALVFDEAIPEDLSEGEIRRLQDKINTWFEKVSIGETKTFIILTFNNYWDSTLSTSIPLNSDIEWKVIHLNDL